MGFLNKTGQAGKTAIAPLGIFTGYGLESVRQGLKVHMATLSAVQERCPGRRGA